MGKLHKPLRDRFYQYVLKTPTCWEWVGATSGDGYGAFQLPDRLIGAHRMAYFIEHGELPNRMLVCHHCDNPLCVRPTHLFLGTHKDNMKDMSLKGRRVLNKTHCLRGHPYDEKNTYVGKTGKSCRTCRNISQRRYIERRNKDL